MAGEVELYRWLVESTADGVVYADDLGREVVVNRAARELLDIPDDVAVSRAYLKQEVGFYPFELLAGQLEDTP
ncbi:MAG: PAS domain-containing protein, partial [Deltaproteobacteria bacterium]|nr:PAS domain-containing protein [Deltaproteobacteria bacterium]